MSKRATPEFNLRRDTVSLDFINTLWRRRSADRTELLVDYEALLDFAELSGLTSPDGRRRLSLEAESEPEIARKVLDEAISLREALYRIFSAIARGEAAGPDDLEIVESWTGRACHRGSLVAKNGHYEWGFDALDDLRLPLWPIAIESVELLRSAILSKVRECAAEDCGWMFLDKSRNQSRRWCNMASCGNRAKAARYRQRHPRVAH